jgi:hypothetical protein
MIPAETRIVGDLLDRLRNRRGGNDPAVSVRGEDGHEYGN